VRPTVLHVGCGHQPLPAWLGGYDEIRLDIDPGCEPDIVASMTDLGDIGPFDALYTSHCLEHLYPDEVPSALSEIRRVLKPGGCAVIIVPNLEGVMATDEPLYMCPIGPVSGLDLIYGGAGLVSGNRHMAHHCGFVRETLKAVIDAAGFSRSEVTPAEFNLIAAAVA
jgi:SAM-dependent methyltransferase